MACLPPPDHIFSILLKKNNPPSRVPLFCNCSLEKDAADTASTRSLAACLNGLVWKLFRAETTCMPVWYVKQGLHPERALEIYCKTNNISRKKVLIIQNGLYNISRWQNPCCSDGCSLTCWTLPSPTYPKVSKPCITSTRTFKLHGWVTLQANSSPAGNHRPAQTNQSPKRDNGLSKGQNVDAGEKRKKAG